MPAIEGFTQEFRLDPDLQIVSKEDLDLLKENGVRAQSWASTRIWTVFPVNFPACASLPLVGGPAAE